MARIKRARDKLGRMEITFGQHIKKARKAKGWSVRELAGSIRNEKGKPATPGYISKIEARGEIPNPEMIIKLAVALGISPEESIEIAKREKAEQLKQNVHRKYDDAFALYRKGRKYVDSAAWVNCYSDSWKDLIVPEAFSHPAKMAAGLLRRILEHAALKEWIQPGDVIVDPFGGIGSTGILGAYAGYQVVCVELEQKFVTMAIGMDCKGLSKEEWVRWLNRYDRKPDLCPVCQAQAKTWYRKDTGTIPTGPAHRFRGNIDLHRKKLDTLGCPQPVIIQGDSRRLCEILVGADAIVGSPPFIDQMPAHDRDFYLKTRIDSGRSTDAKHAAGAVQYLGSSPGQLGAMKPGSVDAVVTSPPWQEGALTSGGPGPGWHKTLSGSNDGNLATHGDCHIGYGSTPGQLGNMKPGQIDAVIASPPYAESLKGDGTQAETAAESRAKRNTEGGSLGQSQRTQGYGSKENLGNLKPGAVDAVVTSPPYEGSLQRGDTSSSFKAKYPDAITGGDWGQQYGKSEGQLGNEQGDTFWGAARVIVQQCHQILREGGIAIWVAKDFVRDGERVDFTGDWRRLCEACGFETLHEHHAMLVREHKSVGLFGQTVIDRKESKSFFRRLSDKKAAEKGYWTTLDESEQQYWLDYASDYAWEHYNSLTAEEKAEYVVEGQSASGLKYEEPTEQSVAALARFFALDMSDDDPNQYNGHVRIDYEVVLCTRKNGN